MKGFLILSTVFFLFSAVAYSEDEVVIGREFYKQSNKEKVSFNSLTIFKRDNKYTVVYPERKLPDGEVMKGSKFEYKNTDLMIQIVANNGERFLRCETMPSLSSAAFPDSFIVTLEFACVPDKEESEQTYNATKESYDKFLAANKKEVYVLKLTDNFEQNYNKAAWKKDSTMLASLYSKINMCIYESSEGGKKARIRAGHEGILPPEMVISCDKI
jgi:hypothetical protein